MHKLSHLQELRRLPKPAKKEIHGFIEYCEKKGNGGKVLVEALRLLSEPGTCALTDTRKQLRPKVHGLAYPPPGRLQTPALSQENATLLLKNAEEEFGSCLAHTSRGNILGYLSLQVDYKEWKRLFTKIEKRRVHGPFSI